MPKRSGPIRLAESPIRIYTQRNPHNFSSRRQPSQNVQALLGRAVCGREHRGGVVRGSPFVGLRPFYAILASSERNV